MVDYDKALLDPSRHFQKPIDILHADLTEEEKYELLKRWEYDIREMQVAEEENMLSNGKILVGLEEIFEALETLHHAHSDAGAPTKQGG